MRDFDFEQDIFGLLKHVGLVPDEVETMPVVQPRLEVDPDRIPVGYLAAVAYEWDTWGQSTPDDFLGMLRCELRGSDQRDLIAAILTDLGRAEAFKEAVDAAFAA